MKSINRAIAVIKPKEPYIDWICSLADAPAERPTVVELSQDCTTYLIPSYDQDEEAFEHIEAIYETIFETELESWCTDPSVWPPERSYEMFREWFEIELHSEIYDSVDGKIRKEELSGPLTPC
jgi:hypothetical protein